MCAIIVANGLSVILAARLSRGRLPESIDVEAGAVRQIVWPRWILFLPSAHLRTEWIKPTGQAEFRGNLEIVSFSRRGRRDFIRRQIQVEDWLGMWSIVFEEELPVKVSVRPPRWMPLGPPFRLKYTNGEGEDFEGSSAGALVDYRAYQPGDPMNRIVWTLLARTGQLHTRTAELCASPMIGIFLLSSAQDEAAAAFAWHLTGCDGCSDRSELGDNWVFGTSHEFSQLSSNSIGQAAFSGDTQTVRAQIIASGECEKLMSPAAVTDSVNAFLGMVGSRLSTLVVLMGEDVSNFDASNLPSCCCFRISQGTDQSGKKGTRWLEVMS